MFSGSSAVPKTQKSKVTWTLRSSRNNRLSGELIHSQVEFEFTFGHA